MKIWDTYSVYRKIFLHCRESADLNNNMSDKVPNKSLMRYEKKNLNRCQRNLSWHLIIWQVRQFMKSIWTVFYNPRISGCSVDCSPGLVGDLLLVSIVWIWLPPLGHWAICLAPGHHRQSQLEKVQFTERNISVLSGSQRTTINSTNSGGLWMEREVRPRPITRAVSRS